MEKVKELFQKHMQGYEIVYESVNEISNNTTHVQCAVAVTTSCKPIVFVFTVSIKTFNDTTEYTVFNVQTVESTLFASRYFVKRWQNFLEEIEEQ